MTFYDTIEQKSKHHLGGNQVTGDKVPISEEIVLAKNNSCGIQDTFCFERCTKTGKQCSFYDEDLQAYLMCPSLIWLQYTGKHYTPSPQALQDEACIATPVSEAEPLNLLNLA